MDTANVELSLLYRVSIKQTAVETFVDKKVYECVFLIKYTTSHFITLFGYLEAFLSDTIKVDWRKL